MLVFVLLGDRAGFAEELDGNAFFERRIRPVLIKHCYECHSAASAEIKGGLRVDSRDAIRKGGESGPAVVPGKVGASLLVKAVRRESFEMPPDIKLPDAVIADLVRWIELGAPDPRDHPPSAAEAAELSWNIVFEERKSWWSLQPPRDVSPPPTEDAGWSRDPVDRFVLAGLREAGLSPAPTADAATLARRLSFVLTGLPPTPDQFTDFVGRFRDDPDRAVATFTDELLASPHFGERIARHWMDVVRYGDTYGYEWDNPAKGAWRYRDYLIRAFNADVGFDQMVLEQLAGDLLASPRIDDESCRNESLVGTMFYHLGEHRHGDSLEFNGIHQEMIDNKINAFSKTFLATTVACARCHDHKLDAVAQRDYYALAGVFMTPRWTTRVVDTPQRTQNAIARLKTLRGEMHALLLERWKSAAAKFQDEITADIKDRHETWRKAFAAKETPSNEDPAYPGIRLETLEDDTQVAKLWGEMADAWRTARETRLADKAKKFNVVTDFSTPDLPAGWTMHGDGMRHGYVRDGTPLVALTGDAIVRRLLPRGYHTHALSSRLPGSLRTPRLQRLGASSMSVALAGREWSGHITLVENAFQAEKVFFLDRTEPQWQRFDMFMKYPDWRVRTEFATSDLNPNFPPRTGKTTVGDLVLPPRDLGDGKRSWFSITGVVTHEGNETPQDTLDGFATLYLGDPPQTRAEARRRIGDWLAGAVRRWADDTPQAGDVALINWLLAHDLLPNRIADDAALGRLVADYRAVEATLESARTVISMDERDIEPVSYRLNIRGNIDDLGDPVPRDFLQVFAGQHDVNKSPGSGRLELATFLIRPDHPLTARVYVNRVWGWVFGQGLVSTPNDFGRLGRPPSHPELLDYIARTFVIDGWSTKRLIRRLVLSHTFRQAGRVTDRARNVDPDNRLLGHYPTRRLEAEAIRDAMLAVSGRLDLTLFGPSIDPPRPKEDEAKRLFSGPVDGNGRRTIYTRITLMEPPKLLAVFNQPSPKISTGRRDVTNAPSQALTLLNDAFITGQAEYWGAALVRRPDDSIEQRIGAMFLTALGRPADDHEMRLWRDAVRDFAADPGLSERELLADTRAWTRIAHVLFNTKEFLYCR